MLKRSAEPSLSLVSRIRFNLHQKGLEWEWEEWVFVMQGDVLELFLDLCLRFEWNVCRWVYLGGLVDDFLPLLSTKSNKNQTSCQINTKSHQNIIQFIKWYKKFNFKTISLETITKAMSTGWERMKEK